MTIDAMQLSFVPQGNENALRDWAREHGDIHDRITNKAVGDGHTNIGKYSFKDMLANFEDFLWFHNVDHENISATYNLAAPPDLSFWDLDEPITFANWLFAHALVHLDIQKGLNIG